MAYTADWDKDAYEELAQGHGTSKQRAERNALIAKQREAKRQALIDVEVATFAKMLEGVEPMDIGQE